MKRPFSISNDGDAYMCGFCKRIYGIALADGSTPAGIDEFDTMNRGFNHVMSHHPIQLLENMDWIRGEGHVKHRRYPRTHNKG